MTRILGLALPVDDNMNPVAWAYADMRHKFEYNASGNLEYIGRASAGTTSNVSGWQIKKLAYETVGSEDKVSSITWADGVISFNKIWDDRGTYTFL